MTVLVVLEQQGGQWHRMSWETLAAGRELAAALGQPLEAVVIGKGIGALAAEAAAKAGKVWAIDHELLAWYTADGYSAALEELIRKIQPSLVLFPHTYQVRDFAPKLATRFGQVLVSDAISARVVAEVDAGADAGGGPIWVRQFFQGKLNGDVRAGGTGPHFASLQAGAWRAEESAHSEAGAGVVETFIPALNASMIRQKVEAPFQETARAVDLSVSQYIVAVGRGIREQSNLGVVEELAKALGAEMAASRPICDAGWLPMERQVGSSGQTVAPKIYFAIGISGAIQHLVGMKGSKTVVAINKDANAPIFEVADYGIVGDLFEVVPALTEEVKKAKG